MWAGRVKAWALATTVLVGANLGAEVNAAPCDGSAGNICKVPIGMVALHKSAWTPDCTVESSVTTAATPTHAGSGCKPCVAKGFTNMRKFVDHVNALNGGKGFGINAGAASEQYFYQLDYTEVIYKEGDSYTASQGKALTEQYFPQWYFAMGSGADCNDGHTKEQIAHANSINKIFMTSRGPADVLKVDSSGNAASYANSNGYAFSIHLNSDHYTRAHLTALANRGLKSVAILTADFLPTRNEFFYGTSKGAIEIINMLKLPIEVKVDKIVQRDGRTADSGRAGADSEWLDNYNIQQVKDFIDAALVAKAEMLIFGTHRQPFDNIVDAYLREKYLTNKHRFKAIYGAWVSWGGASKNAYQSGCGGGSLGKCEWFLGANQVHDEYDETNGYHDALFPIPSGKTKYTIDQSPLWEPTAGKKCEDIYAGLSAWVQAVQNVFYFRSVADPANFLADANAYEAVRAFMRSGEKVADTWQGPISFTSYGQNNGRSPTSLQFQDDGVDGDGNGVGAGKTVFPLEHSKGTLAYPSPTSAECPADTVTTFDAAKSVKAANTCAACPANSVTRGEKGALSAASCACEAGYEKASGSENCAQCAKGHEQPGVGNACTKCQPGSAQAEEGVASCTKCPTGFFSSASGAESCDRCALGFYADAVGSSSCTACPAGLTTKALGASSISECVCPDGYYYGKAIGSDVESCLWPCDGVTNFCKVPIGMVSHHSAKWNPDCAAETSITTAENPAHPEGCSPCIAKGFANMRKFVDHVNALNGGKGFGINAGGSTEQHFYKLDYTEVIYKEGDYADAGKALVEEHFKKWKFVMGSGADCNDGHTKEQIVYANSIKKIFMTSRGPPDVLKNDAAGNPTAHSGADGYAFSIHLNSDHYTRAHLTALTNYGLKSVAVLTADFKPTRNQFFYGTSKGAIEIIEMLKLPIEVKVDRIVERDGRTAETGRPGSDDEWLDNYNIQQVKDFIDEALDKEAEMLIFGTHRQPFDNIVDAYLREKYRTTKHRFKAIYGAWVSWGGASKNAYQSGCGGGSMGTCEWFLGANQVHDEYDDANGYNWYHDALWPVPAGKSKYSIDQSPLWQPTAGKKCEDIYAGLSTFVQAVQKAFYFRPVADPRTFLDDDDLYELLRAFMRSGEKVADTWQGPISFTSYGQNNGRSPTSLQFLDDGVDADGNKVGAGKTIFPVAHSKGALKYPAPMSEVCEINEYTEFNAQASLAAAAVCTVCPANSATQGASNVLSKEECVCKPGFEKDLGSCQACAAGMEQPSYGAVCTPCDTGHYQEEEGVPSCVKCPTGFFSAEKGAAKCERCPAGTYADQSGASGCKVCPGGRTTRASGSEDVMECVCPAGSFGTGTTADDFACHTCPHGYWCPIGADPAVNFGTGMKIRPGYFVRDTTTKAGVLEIYQCDVVVFDGQGDHDTGGFSRRSGEDDTAASVRCPAAVAGQLNPMNGTLCQSGFDADAPLCGRCADGFYPADNKRKCISCDDRSENPGLLLLIMGLVIFALPFLLHVMFNNVAREYSGLVVVQCVLGMFVTSNQLATVVSLVMIKYPPIVEAMFGIVRIFSLDLNVLPWACIAKSDAGLSRFVLLMLIVPITIGWLFLAAFISRKVLPVGNKMRIDFLDAVNAFGMIYQSLFIVVVAWVVQPVRFFTHPEGSSASNISHVLKYQDVEVGSDDHAIMVVLSVLCLFAYVISFISFYVYYVVVLPQRAVRSEAQKQMVVKGFRFMFMRFSPERWYWGGVLLVRNFLCSCVAFFPADQAFMQLLFLASCCLVFLVLQVRYWPWVSVELNYVDTLQMMMMVGLMCSAFPFTGVQMDEDLRLQAGYSMVIFYAIGMGFMVCWTASALIRWSSQAGSGTRAKASFQHSKKVAEVVRQTSLMFASATPEQATHVVGFLDEADVTKLAAVVSLLHCEVRARLPDVAEKIDSGGDNATMSQGEDGAPAKRLTAAERLRAAREKSKRLHVHDKGLTSTKALATRHAKAYGSSDLGEAGAAASSEVASTASGDSVEV